MEIREMFYNAEEYIQRVHTILQYTYIRLKRKKKHLVYQILSDFVLTIIDTYIYHVRAHISFTSHSHDVDASCFIFTKIKIDLCYIYNRSYAQMIASRHKNNSPTGARSGRPFVGGGKLRLQGLRRWSLLRPSKRPSVMLAFTSRFEIPAIGCDIIPKHVIFTQRDSSIIAAISSSIYQLQKPIHVENRTLYLACGFICLMCKMYICINVYKYMYKLVVFWGETKYFFLIFSISIFLSNKYRPIFLMKLSFFVLKPSYADSIFHHRLIYSHPRRYRPLLCTVY